MSSERGFTLLEMLLSVGMLAMLAGLSLPVYMTFQTSNELGITTQNIVSMLRRAQLYSRSGNYDSQWGVRILPDSAVLYKGTSYATRDTVRDEAIAISGVVGVSGMSEVNFAKLTAAPSTTGSVTLNTTTNTRTITINAKGMVEY